MNRPDCPNCGYPNTRDGFRYRGTYRPGTMCQHCGHYEIRTPEPKSETVPEQRKTG